MAGAEQPWKSAEEAAKELAVGVAVVRTMIRDRILPALQIAKDTPWLIKPEDLRRPEVLGYAKKAHAGKSVPREADGQIAISYL